MYSAKQSSTGSWKVVDEEGNPVNEYAFESAALQEVRARNEGRFSGPGVAFIQARLDPGTR